MAMYVCWIYTDSLLFWCFLSLLGNKTGGLRSKRFQMSAKRSSLKCDIGWPLHFTFKETPRGEKHPQPDENKRAAKKSRQMSIWQHVCHFFSGGFFVPWTYRLLRTPVWKIKISSGSVLYYWSYSLHSSSAGYSAAPRCGYTLHFSHVKPTNWIQKASLCISKRF